MIESVNEKAFSEFGQKLASDRNEQLAAAQGNRLPWPSKQLTRMADAGVYRWFVPVEQGGTCLLYTSPSPRDATLSRMPSSA